MTTADSPHANVPADVGAADRIAFGLTFRQLAIIGGVGTASWLLYSTFGHLLPALVWLTLAIPVAGATVFVALGRRDGLPLDVWLLHAVTFTRNPKVYAPGQPRGVPMVAVAGKPVIPAPLRLPVSAISPTGVLSVEGGQRVLVACGTTNIHLHTADEQQAMLDGFGRLLNALTGPAQFLVHTQRLDLAPYANAVAEHAPTLGHPALTGAAEDYAAFLLDLDATRDPLRRQVIAVFASDHDATAAIRTLGGIGIGASTLDAGSVGAALSAAVDPYNPPVAGPRATPDIPITARRP